MSCDILVFDEFLGRVSGWGSQNFLVWAGGLAVKSCGRWFEVGWVVFDEKSVLVVWIDEFDDFDDLWNLQSSRNFVGGEVWVRSENFGRLSWGFGREILMMWIRLNLFRIDSTLWD